MNYEDDEDYDESDEIENEALVERACNMLFELLYTQAGFRYAIASNKKIELSMNFRANKLTIGGVEGISFEEVSFKAGTIQEH